MGSKFSRICSYLQLGVHRDLLGKKLLKKGKLPEAERYYDVSVASYPRNALLRFRLAQIKRGLGKHNEALNLLRPLVDGLNGQKHLLEMCKVLGDMRRSIEAIDAMEAFLHKHPDNRRIFSELTKQLKWTGNLERILELSRSVPADTTAADFLTLIEAACATGHREEAEKYVTAFISAGGMSWRQLHYCSQFLDSLNALDFMRGTPGANHLQDFFDAHFMFSSESADALFGGVVDYSPGYWRSIAFTPNVIFSEGVVACSDHRTAKMNIFDGRRLVVGTPQNALHTVHVFGASQIFGSYLEDEHTVPSRMQTAYNDGNAPVRVVNHGVPGVPIENTLLLLDKIEIGAGDSAVLAIGETHIPDDADYVDLVACIQNRCRERGAGFALVILPTVDTVVNPSGREKTIAKYWPEPQHLRGCISPNRDLPPRLQAKNIRFLCLGHLAERPHQLGEVFIDGIHFNRRLADAVAQEIVRFLSAPDSATGAAKTSASLEFVSRRTVTMIRNTAATVFAPNKPLFDWIRANRRPRFERGTEIGCIVMNCNPFTLGHQYLISKAAEQVNHLYVFVVKEDRSDYPFADRIRLVAEGVAHLGEKVAVLESGDFIISSSTFPGYFSKSSARNAADSTLDILIFGLHIAPNMHITRRFVGEEPTCVVTAGYNQTMLSMLPDLGVAVEVIPRIEFAGKPISASLVRKAVQDRDFDKLKELVPETTYQYLMSRV